MQERLLPPERDRLQAFPRERWEDDLIHVATVPVDYIEWIYDLHGEDVNPLNKASELEGLKALIRRTGIKVRSLWADYSMESPFLHCSEAVCAESQKVLHRLIGQRDEIDVERIVLRFVHSSYQRVHQRPLALVPRAEGLD